MYEIIIKFPEILWNNSSPENRSRGSVLGTF